MTKFTIKTTNRFDRHLATLDKRLGLNFDEIMSVIEEIKVAKDILKEFGTLPQEYVYYLHRLEDEPWAGFMEFHVADDVLVVYADVTAKHEIHLVGIYNHERLRQGKLD